MSWTSAVLKRNQQLRVCAGRCSGAGKCVCQLSRLSVTRVPALGLPACLRPLVRRNGCSGGSLATESGGPVRSSCLLPDGAAAVSDKCDAGQFSRGACGASESDVRVCPQVGGPQTPAGGRNFSGGTRVGCGFATLLPAACLSRPRRDRHGQTVFQAFKHPGKHSHCEDRDLKCMGVRLWVPFCCSYTWPA